MAATISNCYQEIACALRKMDCWPRKGKDPLWLLPYREQVGSEGTIFVGPANKMAGVIACHTLFTAALKFKPFGYAKNVDEEFGDSVVVLVPAGKKKKLQAASPVNLIENLKAYFSTKTSNIVVEGLDDDEDTAAPVEGLDE